MSFIINISAIFNADMLDFFNIAIAATVATAAVGIVFICLENCRTGRCRISTYPLNRFVFRYTLKLKKSFHLLHSYLNWTDL